MIMDPMVENSDVNDSNHSTDPFEQADFPQRQWTDYAEITFLVIMVLIGVPLNIISLFRALTKRSNGCKRNQSITSTMRSSASNASSRLLRFSRHGSKASVRNASGSQFRSMQIHLTIANLMIICVYGVSQICWLSTYQWLGGDALCRIVKFLHTFCFYSTSNMVATIAVDRLIVTIYIDKQQFRTGTVQCLRAATLAAWLLACGASMPQAFLWRSYAPFPDAPDWHQCVTVWVADRHQSHLTFVLADHFETPNSSIQSENHILHPEGSKIYEDLYGGIHLALVFWFPALIVICSYSVIVTKFHRKITKTNRQTTVRTRTCTHQNQFRQKLTAWKDMALTIEPDVSPMVSGDKETSITNGHDVRDLQIPILLESSKKIVPRKAKDIGLTTLARARRTTLRKTMWILLTYVLCWSPYNVLELWRYFDAKILENAYLEFLSNLIVLNAVLNPLIYSM